ncbi:hypothetical protein FIV42_19175 [Persicimonas caeni]|uniref:Uncharacterized protein n=1 Tax=Persicimonas caeni TaxID=2292766 RepID=A0A4Y6PWT4_PERCE|nr:hypothetical protein [Persicimonas caeni]QDG52788.1 hypothetical protein FIV42_19175 [Persicimonas caeni]QED34010.1 hypothetical protein FRD00_19170 [Persicimonas caeni]
MTNTQDKLSIVQTKLDDLLERLERHQNVLESIESSPDGYDQEAVRNYLSTLDGTLSDTDFLDAADESLAPLEEVAEQAKQANLAGAKVFIDDYEIEGVELQYLHEDQMEASLLVESPKVNQLRGGRPRLEMPDGSTYTFTIQQTLIAEVKDDKSGYLELILALDEA